MADEITLTARLDVANGYYTPGTISINSLQIDQAAAGAVEGIQNIGTTEEELGATGLTSKGWLFIRNLDATNYVQMGFATADYGIRLFLPGGRFLEDLDRASGGFLEGLFCRGENFQGCNFSMMERLFYFHFYGP